MVRSFPSHCIIHAIPLSGESSDGRFRELSLEISSPVKKSNCDNQRAEDNIYVCVCVRAHTKEERGLILFIRFIHSTAGSIHTVIVFVTQII